MLNQIISIATVVLFLAISAVIWAVACGLEVHPTEGLGLEVKAQPEISQPVPLSVIKPWVENLSNRVPNPTANAPHHSAVVSTIDHSIYEAILKGNVRGQRVDYLAIREEHYDALVKYLNRMAHVDPNVLFQNEQLAFYINLYNATIINAVVKRFRVGYRTDDNNFQIFDEDIVHYQGKRISLNHLENDIIRKKFNEPRIAVALVCAARSCPPLIARAYRSNDLEDVLEESMKRFVTDDAFRNHVDGKNNTLKLSQIFDWHAGDFGGKSGLKTYINRYHRLDLSNVKLSFIDYSWELNIAPPAEGRWARVMAKTPLYDRPGGIQVGEAEMDDVCKVLQEKDGHVLLSRPLQSDALWLSVKKTEAYP